MRRRELRVEVREKLRGRERGRREHDAVGRDGLAVGELDRERRRARHADGLADR